MKECEVYKYDHSRGKEVFKKEVVKSVEFCERSSVMRIEGACWHVGGDVRRMRGRSQVARGLRCGWIRWKWKPG